MNFFGVAPTCPVPTCGRVMCSMSATVTHWQCPRCATVLMFASADEVAQRRGARADEAKRFAASFPALAEAFRSWVSNDAYYAENGHYRLKSNSGRIAPWSKMARKFYPDLSDFSEAARAVFPNRCED